MNIVINGEYATLSIALYHGFSFPHSLTQTPHGPLGAIEGPVSLQTLELFPWLDKMNP